MYIHKVLKGSMFIADSAKFKVPKEKNISTKDIKIVIRFL